MKTRLLALSVLATILCAQVAYADNRDFTLVNNTPWQVDNVYVVPPSQPGWGSDVLGNTTISAGSSVNVHWPYVGVSSDCIVDVKVVLHGNPPVEARWNSVNVCAIRQFLVWYDFEKRGYQANY